MKINLKELQSFQCDAIAMMEATNELRAIRAALLESFGPNNQAQVVTDEKHSTLALVLSVCQQLAHRNIALRAKIKQQDEDGEGWKRGYK